MLPKRLSLFSATLLAVTLPVTGICGPLSQARSLPQGGFPRSLPQGGLRGGAAGLLNGSTPSAALTAALKSSADRYTWVAATIGSNQASRYQLAVSTYGSWRMAITAPRTTRELPGASKTPRMIVTLQSPGPITATRLTSSTRAGKEIQMSISRWKSRLCWMNTRSMSSGRMMGNQPC